MAPEQVGDGPLDASADRYSLALIAFGLLVGDLPWPVTWSVEQLVEAKRTGDIAGRAASMLSSLPSTRVFERALAASGGARFGSGSDFVTALAER